jgi:hypothetical protein
MNGDVEPDGSLDAVNVGGADAAKLGGGASDLGRWNRINDELQ